jgi:spore coat protein U-like protein
MLRSSLVSFAVAGIALLAGQSAFAGTTPGPFPVTSSVVSACSVTTAASSVLSYDALANAASAVQEGPQPIRVLCTKGASFTIELDQGQNPGQIGASPSSCNSPNRRMKSAAGNFLFYDIARSSDYTLPFGCGTKNKVSDTSISGLTAGTYNRYTSITAGQDVPAGSYTDQVTVTVTF